jgi:hypothetical protein
MMKFVASNTIMRAIHTWKRRGKGDVILMEHLEGDDLNRAWKNMEDDQKTAIVVSLEITFNRYVQYLHLRTLPLVLSLVDLAMTCVSPSVDHSAHFLARKSSTTISSPDFRTYKLQIICEVSES